MNPDILWKIFEFVDEIHNYLGFINALSVLIIFKSFTKNKFLISGATIFCGLLALLIILKTNNVDPLGIQSLLIMLSLGLPVVIYLVLSKVKFLRKAIKILEKTILVIAIFFFYTQAILGGCIIYSAQNLLARDYLRLESWRENGVFGTNIFPGWEVFLRTIYFALATAVLIKVTNPRFAKKTLLKLKKTLVNWHQKSIKKI
jgi:hypothetical protein